MCKPICLLLSCVLLVAGCGDDEETTPVAGSTAEAPEQRPDKGDGSDMPDGPVSAGEDGRNEFENGGEGEHEPEGERADPALDEDAAIETIERYFTVPADRETCALLSERFLRRSFGGLDGCVLGAAQLAGSVEVTPGRTGTEEATGYEIDAADSVYSGEKITVDLVAGPDGWLIDRLEVDAPVGP